MKSHDQKSKAERDAERAAWVEKQLAREVTGINQASDATFRRGGKYTRTLSAKKRSKERRKSLKSDFSRLF